MADDLFDVYEDYRRSKHFNHLRADGIKLVEGRGPTRAPIGLMVVGEAPDAMSSNNSAPFSGRTGAVLDQLLGIAGFTRQDVFLTYVVKYRTPGNRPPMPKEVMRSQRYLRREWLALRPKVTVALGESAAAALDVEGVSHGVLNPWFYDQESSIQHLVAAVYPLAFGLKSHKARSWIGKEWTLLGEEIREFRPDILCKTCHGRGPRGKQDCSCVTPF